MNCLACNNGIDNEGECLNCSQCKGSFHYECLNITKTVFASKSKELKRYWQCMQCDLITRRAKKDNTPVRRLLEQSNMNDTVLSVDDHLPEDDSILGDTILKDNTTHITPSQTPPMNYLLEQITQLLESNKESILCKIKTTYDLQEQIKNLNMELVTAHQEIENLKCENKNLKQILEKQENTLKSVNFSSNESLLQNKKCNTPERLDCDSEINKIIDSTRDTEMDSSLTKRQRTERPQKTDTPTHNLQPQHPQQCKSTVSNSNQDQQNDQYVKEKLKSLPAFLDNTLINTKEKRILILGDQQASGLSIELINSRKNKWNDDYEVSGFIKPDAQSSAVLSPCQSLTEKFGKNDRVILSFGSNDTNPILLLNNLTTALNCLKKTNVFVLEILQNPYLNISLLNYHIKTLLQNYPNCKFIYYKSDVSSNNDIENFSKYINYEIDVCDYNDKYLKFPKNKSNSLLTNNTENKTKTPSYHKGTILYYFKTKIVTESHKTATDTNKNTYKKGTIPYYFLKENSAVKKPEVKKAIFFRG